MIRRIQKSLKWKWMVFSILLATIPLAIAGYNIIWIYGKDLKRSVIEIEEEKANLVVEKTQAFIEKVNINLLSLARDENFRNSGLPHLKGHLENLLYHNDYLIELVLMDEKGQEIIKVSKYELFDLSDLKGQSKSDMFGMPSRGRIFYGEVQLTSDAVPTMVISVPVEEYRGKPVGVLSAKIHLRYLWNLLPQYQIGKTESTFIVDDEGDLIAHPDTRRVLLKENVIHLPMVKRVVEGKNGNLEFEHPRGERFLVVYKPIKELGWGVIIQVPVEEAYAPIKKIAYIALMWILVALSVAIIFSLFFVKRLTQPIKQLSDEMKVVSRGELDIHIKPTTQDEVGLLTESFNQMIQDLKQSHKDLKEAEEKYRGIFENSKDMVYIAFDGKLIDVNQAGVDIFGYGSKEEMKQVNGREAFFYPEDQLRFQNEIEKEGFVKNFEAKLKRKDGILIDVIIAADSIKDGSGKIIGSEGIIKDISERKRMEEKLLQRTKELQSLYQLSSLINQSLNLDEVLAIALDSVVELTHVEMGRILILQEGQNALETKVHRGYSTHFLEKARQIDETEYFPRAVIQAGQARVLVTDEHPSPQLKNLLKEEGIQFVVIIPIMAKDRPVGAINLASKMNRIITRKEIDIFESVGNQIGLAIENARLFSDVSKAKSEWETTFDAVTDLITIKDNDYRILRANLAVFRRYGMKPGEMIGKKCYEIFHHRQVPCEECYVSETFRAKKSQCGESKSLNGIFEYVTFPVLDKAEEVIAVVDIGREVTEKKYLELEKEVINNFNKILASSLDVRDVIKTIHSELKRVFGSDRMTITLLDESGEKLRYFSLEKDYENEELGKDIIFNIQGTLFEKVFETGIPAILSNISNSNALTCQKLLKEGIQSSLIFPLEYKGKVIGTLNFGSKEVNHFSERHFNLLKQIALGLTISVQNVLLLEEIKKSEEKYRRVVESAFDGVCVVDDNYRFSYVNKSLSKILGYTEEELIGMDFQNVLDEVSKDLVVGYYNQWLRREEVPQRFEFNVLRKDGGLRNVEFSVREIINSEGELKFVSFIRDVTEKKKMEEQFLQAEKLRALGEMASGVAHDFNNSLAAILGNTQLLLYNHIEDEEVKETLKVIEKVTKDSAHTVRRLQDFTRKRGHQELFKLDINSIVKDAIEITKPKWKDISQSKGIHIEMVSDFGNVPPVAGNASEMREVIINMIFNAIEAMLEGGKLELRTFQKKDKVCIQISDNGIGMTEEVRKKIFEPFFTTKSFNNSGLGLSVCYGIIQRFGGEISVESKVRKGTIFTITLPIGLEGKEEVIAPSVIKKGKEARILVVDDEDSVRNMLSRILSRLNHKVVGAKNGEEAIRLFKEGEFDLVLTDLGMPGMSGWEVCQAIKEISPRIPVGMITGWGMELNQSKIKEYDLNFLISKPFEMGQISKIVAETIESSETQFQS